MKKRKITNCTLVTPCLYTLNIPGLKVPCSTIFDPPYDEMEVLCLPRSLHQSRHFWWRPGRRISNPCSRQDFPPRCAHLRGHRPIQRRMLARLWEPPGLHDNTDSGRIYRITSCSYFSNNPSTRPSIFGTILRPAFMPLVLHVSLAMQSTREHLGRDLEVAWLLKKVSFSRPCSNAHGLKGLSPGSPPSHAAYRRPKSRYRYHID